MKTDCQAFSLDEANTCSLGKMHPADIICSDGGSEEIHYNEKNVFDEEEIFQLAIFHGTEAPYYYSLQGFPQPANELPPSDTNPWTDGNFDHTINFYNPKHNAFYFCKWENGIEPCHKWDIASAQWIPMAEGPSESHNAAPILVFDDGRVVISAGEWPEKNINEVIYDTI